MFTLKKALSSSVGKKFIVGLSAFGVVGFVIQHLAANFMLYLPEGDRYNAYVEALHSWGNLLIAAEIGLLLLFLTHIVMAIAVTKDNKQARPQPYAAGLRSKGGPTRSNVSSRHMAISGLVLLVFLVVHVWHFRFGLGIPDGYVTDVDGREARDLFRLVIETFQQWEWVVGYVGAMLFLGLHIRHGFWSMFQSLGLAFPRFTNAIHALGLLVALVLAVGFLGIPIWIFFDIGGLIS